MNVNHPGDALLGEKEARRRLDTYIEDMKNPEIEYISVKISTIMSQIHPLAFECTVGELKARLTELYDAARKNYLILMDGTSVPKFVNLDMEEYRDLEARDLSEYFYFEMLDGMADHVRRALCEMSGDVLLYDPVAKKGALAEDDDVMRAVADRKGGP